MLIKAIAAFAAETMTTFTPVQGSPPHVHAHDGRACMHADRKQLHGLQPARRVQANAYNGQPFIQRPHPDRPQRTATSLEVVGDASGEGDADTWTSPRDETDLSQQTRTQTGTHPSADEEAEDRGAQQ